MGSWQPLYGLTPVNFFGGFDLLVSCAESSPSPARHGTSRFPGCIRPLRNHKRIDRVPSCAAAAVDVSDEPDQAVKLPPPRRSGRRRAPIEDRMPSEKTCTNCERVLPADSFLHSFSSRDGLQHWCKDCKREEDVVRKGKAPVVFSVAHKSCQQCHEVKPVDDFYINRAQKRGLSAWCKPCTKKVIMEYQKRVRLEFKDVDINTGVKQCQTCGVIRPLTSFYRNHCSRDGKHQHCKLCWKSNQRMSEMRMPALAEGVSEKVCGRCGKLQPSSAFHKYHKSVDGLQSYCKVCIRNYTLERVKNLKSS